MKRTSEHFNIPQDENGEESKRRRRQESCSHEHYSCICASCSKVLGSEMHFTSLPQEHPGETVI